MASSSPSKSMDAPLTISTLLNSLHSHLQTQTQLLPTLHAQLGLPQSALTDELSALHQRLATCVEQQIELRREEVQSWMKKCDDVEHSCSRYIKALGGHVKAIGASLGELRKQQVLPVRHEMLNQFKDKLDQLYKTKTEQLTNLLNRVTSLTRTLDTDFFSIDIMELTCAPGEDSSDLLALRDVTPERFSKLEKELVRGKGEITRRLQHLSETMLQIDWLYNELEIPPPISDEDDMLCVPSTQRCLSASIGLSDPFMSSVSSISTPTPLSRGQTSSGSLFHGEQSSSYQKTYALFISRIDIAEASGNPPEPGSLIGLEGVEPTTGLLNWAETTLRNLEDTKKRREAAIQSLYDQLEALWKRLGVEDIDIDSFVEHHRGSTDAVVQAYEAELERMLELKRERMSVFIESARQEIEKLWDELMVSEEERADFAPFADDEHTEELLTIHEEEIRRLKEERKLKGPLLANIRKYFEICEEERELVAAAQDQSRLMGRGPRDPGRLLREEKMRKRVTREKPKLEHDLMRTVPAWEEEHSRPFLVNGMRVVDFLAETISAADKENTRKQKPRAGSVPPRATTPGASAVRPPSSTGSNSNTGPNKRARLAASSGQNIVPTNHRTNGTHEHLPHRAAFGSRSGALNSAQSDVDTVLMTTQKPSKTPSTSSSLPRPRSVADTASKLHPSLPVSNHGTSGRSGYGVHGIGLGYASTMAQNRPGMVSSTSTSQRTFSLMSRSASQKMAGRDAHAATATLLPKRSARNSRRESFRPRQSVDGGGSTWSIADSGSRYGGIGAQAVREEDEY